MSTQTVSLKPQTATTSLTPAPSSILQRKCACGNHTVAGGECAACGTEKNNLQRKANNQSVLGTGFSPSRTPFIQPKLTIGASNDPLEQEADRVADQVLAAPAHSTVGGAPLHIQRHARQATERTETAPASVDHVLASTGRPLDPALRQDMETRFGYDFSRVRVHSGGAAEQSARDVKADAYTAGHDIVFGAGRFAPATHEGKRLIAHELTHVVQQSSLGDDAAVRQSNAPLVQRQITVPIEPPFRPVPIPRIGPLPRVGPVPEVGPLPPIVVPFPPGDFEPEIEIEDIPEDEEIEDSEDSEGSTDPQPEPEAEPPVAEAQPQPQPWPVPPIAPDPVPKDKQEDQNVCGSKRMPLTKVSWSTGPLGQGGTVRASPLTRCPGNTIGSQAKPATYRDQFQCIKKAKLSRTWLPLHLLHGPSPRPHTRLRNLHGPGDERWNIIIGDAKLNGQMYKAVEDFVINRIYDWNQVLWLESKVVEYFPGAEFFAKKITLAWGLYNTATNSEVTTIGGGTFENDSKNLPPPSCPPTSRAGASAVAPGAASAFDTTISICHKSLKSKQPIPVTSGGLELTLRARAQGQNCNIADYSVALWKFNKNWIDGAFGSKTVPADKTVKLRWRNLPAGDYYFVFTVGPHAPSCCLKGDMSVRTFSTGVPWV
jgi:hypothetical protein